jgi:hypothetical protein
VAEGRGEIGGPLLVTFPKCNGAEILISTRGTSTPQSWAKNLLAAPLTRRFESHGQKPKADRGRRPDGKPKHQRPFMIGSVILAIGLSTFFYMHAVTFPSCCDTGQYVEMARYFEANGFIANAPHADMRTFGYPLFLSLVFRAADAVGIPLMAAVFLAQLAMYLGCVAFLYRRLAQSVGPAVGATVFYGLTFNVLLLPYLSLTLTDGFSVILLLGATFLLIGVSAEDRPGMVAFRAVLLGLVVGFAVVVRPANLWFGSLIVIGALLVFRKRGRDASRRPEIRASLGALLFVAIAVMAGLAATVPQSALNWARARQVTPLPTYDLKTKQVEAGLRNIKYATNMVGGPAGLFYRNPLFSDIKGRHGIEWYFHEPLRGVATLALRMFGGFDFDYLFPYIYDLRPSYRPALFVISQFIVFFGLGGAVLLAYPPLARRVLGESSAEHFRWKAPITAGQVFIPVFVAWGAIYGVSAIENRFALPMITVLMPVAVAACWALVRVFRSGMVKRGLWVLAGFLVWITLAMPLARILEQAKQLPSP